MPSQKGLVHILVVIILLLGIIATLYLSQHTQVFKPRAIEQDKQSEITKLTTDLITANDQFSQRTSADGRQPNLNEMLRIARERKEKLLEEAELNPKTFLELATLVEERSSFPQDIQSFIEEEKTLQGKLKVFHQDDFENRRALYFYSLKDTSNKNYDLHFVNNPSALLSDSIVRIDGISLEDQFVSDETLQVIESFPIPDDREKRVAVVLLKYPSNQSDPFYKDEIARFMFSDEKGFRSARNWYRENSGDSVRLSGDVLGFYTIIPDVDPGSIYPTRQYCDDDYIKDQAGIELSRNNVSLDSYDIIVYVSPPTANCRYPFAQMGGEKGLSFIFINNNSQNIINRPDVRTFLHELGHNLGVDHANSYYCYPRALDISRNCDYDEYGDIFDVMGYFIHTEGAFYFNTPHKVALGWIPQDRVSTLTQSGEYQICTSEYAMNCPQALKIRINALLPSYYYLGYRQPWVEDGLLPNGITRGISIHRVFDPPLRTEFIDTTPESALDYRIAQDQALSDGSTFNDEINNIQITQIRHDQWTVTVRITLPASPNIYPYPTPQ